jgi:hypothetical protein
MERALINRERIRKTNQNKIKDWFVQSVSKGSEPSFQDFWRQRQKIIENTTKQIQQQRARHKNPAVQWFGENEILKYFSRNVLDIFQNERVVVSVGSGEAVLENRMREVLGLGIVCIDPDPGSYSGKNTRIEPMFTTTRQAAAAEPALRGRLMLINWPDPDNDGYDTRALTDLRPRCCLVITEISGKSGSEGFVMGIMHDRVAGYTFRKKQAPPPTVSVMNTDS